MYTHTSFGFCVVLQITSNGFLNGQIKPFKISVPVHVFCFVFFKIAALSPCHTVHLLKRMLPTKQGEMWQWFQMHNVTTLSPTKHCKTCDIYLAKFDPHPLTWKERVLWPHTVCLVLQCFIITSWLHAGISYLTLSSKTCMFCFS